MDLRKRVLFICTANTARSQMAEGLLRYYAGDEFDVHSAGLRPGVIHPMAIQVMNEINIDISGQSSKGVEKYLGKLFLHYLITVCHQAEKNCPSTWPGVQKKLHWSFEDPAAFQGSEVQQLERFRKVRDQIDTKIRLWLIEQSYEL